MEVVSNTLSIEISQGGAQVVVRDMEEPAVLCFDHASMKDTETEDPRKRGCQYWNETLQKMSTDGVEVVIAQCTDTRTCCQTTHFTEFTVFDNIAARFDAIFNLDKITWDDIKFEI